MGAHIPRIRGLRHAGEEEAMPARGFMFDTDDPGEMAKWRGWRRAPVVPAGGVTSRIQTIVYKTPTR
ncbi:Nramp family divalent metal transporter [Actinosynnema sp. NPDC091369]